MKRIITFGTYDLFHYGHLKILERAKQLGDHLTVGISTDALNFSKKKRHPTYNQDHRLEIIKAIKYVDEVFFEHSLELKADYIKQYNADVLVMGSDWEGKFDHVCPGCEVIYLPRTDDISSTDIHIYIAKNAI